jgi:dTDP-L-rhamnose 4-epimerase
MRVVVFGGAGFIGSHTVDALVARGHDVCVFDSLEPQVHGSGKPQLNRGVQFILGDIRNPDAVQSALKNAQAAYFLAAAVGVGQSMYEIRRYVDVNSVGAATVLEVLASKRDSIERLVVASSMAIYGEGAYVCETHGQIFPTLRPDRQLAAHDWELRCPKCERVLSALPTAESKPFVPTSVYAITKRDHEELFLVVGRAYGIPTIALRYFNVYGPRQALSNPYTGAVAIFTSRILNQRPPLIYEDGNQTRDFVHVNDIVQANILALERREIEFGAFNVGTGTQTSVLEMAKLIGDLLGYEGEPDIVGSYRAGDIRHCFADISLIRDRLGYSPSVQLREGLAGMTAWLKEQDARDQLEQAHNELVARGLVK